MRRRVIIALLALIAQNVAFAQKANDDRVIMKINGKPVMRSEFEYSYNKNNSEGVIDKKTVEEYVDLFINYKLKVEAALDAKLDTMKSFNDETHHMDRIKEIGNKAKAFDDFTRYVEALQ